MLAVGAQEAVMGQDGGELAEFADVSDPANAATTDQGVVGGLGEMMVWLMGCKDS